MAAYRSAGTEAARKLTPGANPATQIGREKISRRAMLVALAGSGWWLTQPVQAAEPTGRRFAFLVGVTQ
jgi:hypothetical protein